MTRAAVNLNEYSLSPGCWQIWWPCASHFVEKGHTVIYAFRICVKVMMTSTGYLFWKLLHMKHTYLVMCLKSFVGIGFFYWATKRPKTLPRFFYFTVEKIITQFLRVNNINGFGCLDLFQFPHTLGKELYSLEIHLISSLWNELIRVWMFYSVSNFILRWCGLIFLMLLRIVMKMFCSTAGRILIISSNLKICVSELTCLMCNIHHTV